MNQKFASLLVVFLLACSVCSAAQSALVPGASNDLAGTPEAFLASCRSDLEDAKKRITTLKASQAPRDAMTTLQDFDTARLVANDAQNRAQLAEQVHPAKPFRDAAQTCEQESNSLLTDISLDKEMYSVLSSLDGAKLDPAATYFFKTTLLDYHRAGVDRDDATRAKIRDLQEQLVKIGQQFDQNIAADVRKFQVNAAELDGLPEDFKRSHPADASGKVTLTTDNTDYYPFMEYATSEPARKAFYVLYRQRAYPKNIEVMAQLLQKRYELAHLLGYADWAAYITENKMVGTEQNAAAFIEKISAAAQDGSKRDYEELLAYKKHEDPKANSINAWDVSHLTRGAKLQKFGYDAQAMRPYFEYSRVLQGILDITSQMYGVTYKPVSDAKVWHPEVTVYDVFDKDKRIGRIYFDMFPRENKYKHYATFGLATGKQAFRLPEYVLVCNFPRATNEPGLMEYDDVIIFFHEFGHLVHGIMAGDTQWATGDLETDFVEAPSQMFEEWPKDPAVLKLFARDYKTNQPIPAELAEKARAADDFGRALNVRTQMFYAAISLDFHNRDPKGLDQDQLVAQLQTRYTPFQFVPDTHMQTAFGHLNGYSAYYYTYMWSLVIAKDMFTEFKKNGLMNPEIAGKYRHRVLGASGTMPAADLVRDFLGRTYSFQAYADWLNGK